MNYGAFLSYVFLSSVTPGPNNITSMSNAMKYGLPKGLRFNFGVLFGIFILVSICAAFAALLHSIIPQIEPYMLCLGSAYILYLAWTIYKDDPTKPKKKRTFETNSIPAGMMLQFVNVKAIMYGITGISTFVLPYYPSFLSLLPFAGFMALFAFLCTCLWALFGTVFEKFFTSHQKLLNTIMALLLVYCAVSQLLELF